MSATSSSPQSSPPDASAHPWREALLWAVFAGTLFVGLGLAVVYGPAAPVLIDTVAR